MVLVWLSSFCGGVIVIVGIIGLVVLFVLFVIVGIQCRTAKINKKF